MRSKPRHASAAFGTAKPSPTGCSRRWRSAFSAASRRKRSKRRVAALIAQLGPLPPVGDLSTREILNAISHDKKIVAGTLHFIAATDIGATTTLTDVNEKQIRAALKAIGIVRA